MLPDNFIPQAAGCCQTAARIICGKMLENGMSVSVVEGWIQFIDDDGDEDDSKPSDLKFAHTWVECDGEIIDPTIIQFDDYLQHYHYEREIMLSVPAGEYLSDPRINTQHPEMFFNDGEIPDECRKFLPETATKTIKP